MLQTDSQGQLDADREPSNGSAISHEPVRQMNSYLVVYRRRPVQQHRQSVHGGTEQRDDGGGFGGNMYDYFNRNRQPTRGPKWVRVLA